MTAAASAGPMEPSGSPGATLGRYRLERELGAGAMGVVHAAFDPDLERRIALKVIKSATATAESRDRLLREARAMARLSHPNVVTVHEVGTAGGRDFVAMELIDGESLAEWLRGKRRSTAAILDVFVAAGRGLAAAHAAGIVHRDFKPHNVLRSGDGRIVVTDFGLARDVQVDVEAAPPPALDEPALAGARSLALTMTGALLGTPPYMAPEQWRGGAVSPAPDQFAYCVALWEALAGVRPFPGPTIDDLRAQITRGPAALDASRIPRRLRGILRRGLALEPTRRWPGMEALLAQLVRAQRRPVIAVALATGAIVAAAVVVLALRGGDAALAACGPPERDVETVWSPALRGQTQVNSSAAHAAVLDAASWRWRAVREAACRAPLQGRPAQLACLDGVENRFDVLRQAFARVPAAAAEDLQASLADPQICLQPVTVDVPRLTLAPTPAVIDAYALYARSQTAHKPAGAEVTALADHRAAEPCARAVAALAFDDASQDTARQRAVMSRALGDADQCGDERLRADLRLRAAQQVLDQLSPGDQRDAAVRQAELAAQRVMQPELAAAVAALNLRQAGRRGDRDAEFRLIDEEIVAYRARGLVRRELEAVIERNRLRMQRLAAGDLAAVTAELRHWRPVTAARHWTELARQLDVTDATVRWIQGDVASAHADILRLWQTRPPSGRPGSERVLTGEVIDDRGRRLAGATVASDFAVFADSLGIGLPFNGDDTRIATSDASGRFTLHDTTPGGAIVAQLGDQRSVPVVNADHLRLVVEPTRRVSGKVDLGGVDHTRVNVVAFPLAAAATSVTLAPVAVDGTFSLSGVPRGAVLLLVRIEGWDSHGVSGEYRRLPASPASVADLELAIKPAPRALDLVVRSSVATSLGEASAWVLPGHWEIKTIGELLRSPVFVRNELHPQPVGDNAPPALASRVRRDDLLAHIDHLPEGELTVCACSIPTDASTSEQQLRAHLTDLVVRCKHTSPGDPIVVIDVPPQQRFD
jgi:predicted Ser/Thr protein kinase